MPAATPGSTATRATAETRAASPRRHWKTAGTVVVVAVVLYVLVAKWRDVRNQPLDLRLSWSLILLASALWLSTYALLIETWRRMLRASGDTLRYTVAARIWFVSSLTRYLVSVASVGVMAVMARDERVSPEGAAATSVLNVVVNLMTGSVIALVFGYPALQEVLRAHAAYIAPLFVAAVIGIALAPMILARLLPAIGRLIGRSLAMPRLTPSMVVPSVVGNAIAWIMYGCAFRWFALGVIDADASRVGPYVVVWATAYIAGYVAFLTPSGLGVREAVLTAGLSGFGLANPRQALVISVTQRLWTVVLEIVPGLLFLAFRPRSPRHDLSAQPTSGSVDQPR